MEKKYLNPNILDEGNQMEIIQENEDPMKTIVRCNNCGKPTEYGDTRMCSGFVGCDNKIEINGVQRECYFEDLMPRVIAYKNSKDPEDHKKYISGKLYRWRDKIGE